MNNQREDANYGENCLVLEHGSLLQIDV